MPKTNKSFLKRIRITKNGKMIHRTAGQNHYNAKESRRRQRRKNSLTPLTKAFQKHLAGRINA